MKENTVIIPVVRTDLLPRCLETLYKNTVPNFYVIVVDQTTHGLDINLRDRYPNLTLLRTPKTTVHHTGNLGFAKANNFAFKLVETPYFTMCNDDIEFLDRRWWDGVMRTFEKVEQQTPERPAVIVTPASTKLPDWSIGKPKGEDHYIIPYKKRYTPAEYDSLLEEEHYVNEHLTLKPGSVIDGVTLYCSVFHTERFKSIGLLPEQLYAGGGEDYWYSALAYMSNYRCVGTTMSWVFHHWSSSIGNLEAEEIKSLIQPELQHNDNHADWGDGFDIWGYKCSQCGKNMKVDKRDHTIARCPDHNKEIYNIPESKVLPL